MATPSLDILALKQWDISWGVVMGSLMSCMGGIQVIAYFLKKYKINPMWAIPLGLAGGGLLGGLMTWGIYWWNGY
jgi:hypothetical protein